MTFPRPLVFPCLVSTGSCARLIAPADSKRDGEFFEKLAARRFTNISFPLHAPATKPGYTFQT